MAGSNHNGACATAGGHVCRCSGCGGALHGWQGWFDLATGEPEAREARRKTLESKAASARDARQLRPVYLDLARLDITDYLARPEQRSVPAGSTEVSGESGGQVDPSSELGQVMLLARRTMADTWRDEIKPELDRVVPAGTAVGDVAREMASHVWCDLLIALVRLIQRVHDAVDLLSEKSKSFVKQVLLKSSSKKGLRKHVAEAVIDLVVGKVWSALRGLVATKLPILGPGVLRALRMLAVFTCPAPEAHREVHEHAVVPLMNDARGVISDEVKAHVIALVPKMWRRGTATNEGL
jgi:hypothetical protein